MSTIYEKILQRCNHILTTRLIVDEEFISRCVSMELITHDKSFAIMALGGHARRATELLGCLRLGEPDTFNIFVHVLKETKNDSLARKLMDAEEMVNAEGAMSPERTASLQQCCPEITNIRFDRIWDKVDHIFSPIEQVQIKEQTVNERKMATLLDILSRKSDIAFDHLVRALRTIKTELAGRLEHGEHEEEIRPENQEISNKSIIDSPKMKN